MAAEFKLELDLKDLVKSIDALDDVSSHLASITRQVQNAQSRLAAKNVGDLTKLVNAIKRKQQELSYAFMNTKVGQAMQRWKSNLATAGQLIQKGIVQPLGKALSIARNMGLAIMGAASAALYFSRGSTQKQTEAKTQGFNNLKEAKTLQYANDMTGRNLNMANFNNLLLSNTEGWDQFANLGLNKDEFLKIAQKKGTLEAYLAFHDAIAKQVQKGQWTQKDGSFYEHKINALSQIEQGADAGFVKSFYGSRGTGTWTDFKHQMRTGVYSGYNESDMVANDRAMTQLGAQFENLKSKMVGLFAPELEKVIKGIAEGLKQLHKWLGSEEGKAAMQKFKDGLSQAATIIKDMLIAGLVGLAKLLNKLGLVNLDKGTIEWLDSLLPKKTTEDTNKEIREGKRGFIQGIIDSATGRSMAAYQAEAKDISSTAQYMLAMNKGKLTPEQEATLSKYAGFNADSAYVNTRYFNKEANEAREAIKNIEVTLRVDNRNGSEVSMISAGGKQ